MVDALQTPYVQRALLELALLSLAAGVLGTWIVLRGLAFFSHAVGTAAFPGLVLADGVGFAAPVGAFATAGLMAAAVGLGAARRRADQDAVTAIVLVGALALGVILASDVYGSGASVETLLFGSLLLIDSTDLALAAAAGGAALLAGWLLGRRWLVAGFDPESARALGVRSPAADAVLLALVALASIAALQALGALLATALLVVPAATARPWARRMRSWQLATGLLAAFEGAVGVGLSVATNAPPGATIAVLAGAGFALSALARALPRRRRALAAAALAALLGLAGCGGSVGAGDRLRVVATTTQIADWTRAVGGGAVDVHQILQPNTDPHEYEPRPRDVQATADARLVLVNGDGLDGWMGKVVAASGGRPRVVDLGTVVPDRPPGAARADPHWWHDPRNAQAAVVRIAAVLAHADPGRAAQLRRRAAAYRARLRRLDAGIARCLAAVPRARRRLVSDHDAFTYFARRYGVEVVGAVLPSQTTEAQASARDVARLVATIRRERVAAVLPESSVNAKLVDAIAAQTGSSSDLTLYGDALGPPGSPGATYVGMEAANADAMVRGFTRGRRGCRIRGIR